MNVNMLGVEYIIGFSDKRICNCFEKQLYKCDFINVVKESSSRCISLLFTDSLNDFECAILNSNYIYVNDFTFNQGMEYLFNIKDFSVYLDTKKDTLVVYALPNILYKYCFEIFKHLHFKIFYQMKSIMLHAGAVYTKHAVLVFAGESHAGKSTTCARCVLEGTHYLTDENLIFTNDGDNIILSTLETRLALRDEAVELFPKLNKFTFNKCDERIFVDEVDNGNSSMSIYVPEVCAIKMILISKNGMLNNIIQLVKSTLRRTNGTYMIDEYKINLFRFISAISNNMQVWNPPIDDVAFSRDLNNMLSSNEKGNTVKGSKYNYFN